MANHRLPRDVLPSHYDLTLEPDLDAGTFMGTAAISITTARPVSEIALHAVDLEITDARLTTTAGAPIVTGAISYLPDLERALVALPAPLPPGVYVLSLLFGGALTSGARGFHRCRVTDGGGAERTIAVTQLQGGGARRVFPCFDEPALKATFAVTLVTPRGLEAVSNTPLTRVRPYGDGKQIVRFEPTIAMSPHLVAIAVGPLAATPVVDVDGVALRTLFAGDRRELTRFSLEVAGFALRFYRRRYGMPYPGKKLDQIAVPDLAAAGTEGLGCIAYRDELLLLDRERATPAELVRSADVITHEIAHMWFGDLVTMAWWDGLWLNEAFATFMALSCVDAFNGAWHRWGQFVIERSRALELDALESARPLEAPVETPLQGLGTLTVLAYRKGAALLRMLEQFVGTDVFFEGVNRYLRTHAYGCATADDLWAAIEAVTRQPVAAVMRSWTQQPGYPIVSVALSPDRRRLAVAQAPFRLGGGGNGDGDGPTFAVPLRFRSLGMDGAIRHHRLLLDGPATEIELPEPTAGVLMNAGAHGFYRVRYEPALRRALLAGERAWNLSPEERYAILDDCWATVREGTAEAIELLELAASARRLGLSDWTLLAGAFDALGRIVDPDAADAYQARVCELARAALRRLGWEAAGAEPGEARELRGVLIRLLGTTGGAPEVIAKARRVHDRYLHEPASIDPEVAAAAAAVVARSGGDDDYAVFARRAVGGRSPREALRYARALGDFPGEAHVERTLAMCLDGAIRRQDAPAVLSSCLANRDRGARAWGLVKERWDHLQRAFPPLLLAVGLAGVAHLDRPEVAGDVLAFLGDRRGLPGRLLAPHLERLRVGVALRLREGARLSQALRARGAAARYLA